MTRYFTQYWLNRTWYRNLESGGEGALLTHSGSDLFVSRGVRPGDQVYMVTVLNGELYLCGKMEVAKLCSLNEAAEYLGFQPDELWQAREHIVARAATPMSFLLRVPLPLTRRLTFKVGDLTKPLTFESRTHLDRQTLRGVRELDQASARDLDTLLPSLIPFSHQSNFELPEEVADGEMYYEGATKQIKVNSYERNPKAREECISFYGPSCCVCNFDFGSSYGDTAKGFIHVHHLRPLAEIGEEYELDPVRDMRPICPNCHAMIHMKVPAHTIKEMKRLVRKAKTQPAR